MCNEIEHDHTLHESLHHNEHRQHPSPRRHPSSRARLRTINISGIYKVQEIYQAVNPLRLRHITRPPPVWAARFFTGSCGPKLPLGPAHALSEQDLRGRQLHPEHWAPTRARPAPRPSHRAYGSPSTPVTSRPRLARLWKLRCVGGRLCCHCHDILRIEPSRADTARPLQIERNLKRRSGTSS